MLLRVAQALLAIGRDVERAGIRARLLEVGQGMMLEGGRANGSAGVAVWEPVVAVAGSGDPAAAEARTLVRFLALSPDGPASVLGCIRSARTQANTVRDHLPTDLWEVINEAHLDLGEWSGTRLDHAGVYGFCRRARHASHLLEGVADQVMRRGPVWRLLRMGRFLERARAQAALLDAVLPVRGGRAQSPISPDEEARYWRGVLDASSAYEAFLDAGMAQATPGAVTDFLVRDADFPRSLRFALSQIRASLAGLASDGAIPRDAPVADPIDGLLTALDEPMAERIAVVIGAVPGACATVEESLVGRPLTFHRSPSGSAAHAQAAHQTQN